MADFLNYPGDCSDIIENCQHPMGPDLHRGYWIPVEAIYDPATDRTRVRMRPGSWESLAEAIEARKAKPVEMGALERMRRRG